VICGSILHQQRNEVRVGGWKIQRRELIARDPAHLLSEDWPRFIEQVTPEEVQFDDAFGIRVGYSVNLLTHSKSSAELFANLAMEARLQCFAGMAFSTRELPEAGKVRASKPASDEKLVIAFDDGRRHDDCRRRHHRAARSCSGLNG
jgi:hypothetical protein